jgi:death on curing protein
VTEPERLSKALILAIHDEQLAEHGGGTGVRDDGLLESALARPQNRLAYDAKTDLPALAAAYAFGLARNHPFVDGNKRTAFVAAGAFLLINGYQVTADNGTVYEFVIAVAAGEIDEDGAAAFFRDHIEPVEA